MIFEVSDSVFYRSRSNIDIGKTAQHMRNFSNKSNVTPLISDDCSDKPVKSDVESSQGEHKIQDSSASEGER